MAITKLSTDFVDDIIDTSVNEHRKYKMTSVSGEADTYELEDTTTYTQVGTPYDASVVNNTNGTINQVIDLAEDNADDLAGFLDGSVPIARAGTASTATNATTANSANTATSAGKLTTARKINGVDFDGSNNITVYDNTKVGLDTDFILINQQRLTFVNRVCTISDARITASSLADVYFTSLTESIANNADIVVETSAGAVTLTASNTPTGNIEATIHIRVA